jgi:hypothetical protein
MNDMETRQSANYQSEKDKYATKAYTIGFAAKNLLFRHTDTKSRRLKK